MPARPVVRPGIIGHVTSGMTGDGCTGGGSGDTAIFNSTYSWGTVLGSANLKAQSLTGQLEISSPTSVIVASGINDRVTTTLYKYSEIQVTQAGSNYSVYLYTKSAYAPAGDRGTFLYSSTGTLLSESATAVQQLVTEIAEADPDQDHAMTAMAYGMGGWGSSHLKSIQACGQFSAESALLGAVLVGSDGAALAIAGFGFDTEYGYSYGISAAQCF